MSLRRNDTPSHLPDAPVIENAKFERYMSHDWGLSLDVEKGNWLSTIRALYLDGDTVLLSLSLLPYSDFVDARFTQ